MHVAERQEGAIGYRLSSVEELGVDTAVRWVYVTVLSSLVGCVFHGQSAVIVFTDHLSLIGQCPYPVVFSSSLSFHLHSLLNTVIHIGFLFLGLHSGT